MSRYGFAIRYECIYRLNIALFWGNRQCCRYLWKKCAVGARSSIGLDTNVALAGLNPFEREKKKMARDIQKWRRRYPNTMAFLRNTFPDMTEQSSSVWSAFQEKATLSEDRARQIITFNGTPPLIWFSELGGLAGFFEPEHPARFLIDAGIALRFEEAASRVEAQTYLQAKVLHEMVHWSLFDQGDKEPGNEEWGLEFEVMAYPNPPRPFWLGQIAGAGAAHAADADEVPPPIDHGMIESAVGIRDFSVADIAGGLPRGIRNNNPGNIKRSSTRWEGLADPDEMTDFQRREIVFCVFSEPVWGLRAMARILHNYQHLHRLTSVDAMIGRWAPPEDNNATADYADFVAERMGLNVGETFDFLKSDLASTMIQAMVRMENGIQPYTPSQIKRAHAMASA